MNKEQLAKNILLKLNLKTNDNIIFQNIVECIQEYENSRILLRINPLEEKPLRYVRNNFIDFEGLADKFYKENKNLEFFFLEDLKPMGSKLIQFKKNARRRPTTLVTYNNLFEGKLILEVTELGNIKVNLNKDYFKSKWK